MKVPHNVVGRTRPTSQGMDPLRVRVDEDAFGAGLSRGLDNLGAGLLAKANQNSARTEKLDRFQSMSNYSDFELNVNSKLAELKKTADPTGKGFTEAANKMYDIAADEFITKMVPEDMRMEARYWTSNTRQRIIGDSMNFQYEAGNAYFRAGVDKQFQTSLKALDPKLGGDPTRLQMEKDATFAMIDASDLSEIEKGELKRNVAVGLEGVVYKQAVKLNAAKGGINLPETVGLIIDDAAARYGVDPQAMRAIAWIESKGNPSAKNPNSSAGGLFQQIDANARQYGVTDRFDPVQSADGAARFAAENIAFFKSRIGREPTAGEIYLMHQQGPGSAVKLLANPGAKAVDLVSNAAVTLNGGNANMTAGEFAKLWDNKVAKAMGAPIDQLPIFSSLGYQDRSTLKRDGQAEYEREAADQAAAEKFRVDTLTNNLMNRINDGLAGTTEIEAARAEGWLTDYDDISKAQNLFEKRNSDAMLVGQGYQKLETGATFDPMSEDDKKMLNAMVGKPGLTALDNMDHAYLVNGLVPVVTRAGDIPTDVVGMLTGMVRSNNQSKALFAYDALAMMQDADPRAFDARVSDALAADVNFYRQRRTALPADELFGAINGGATQAERQGRAILYQEAQDVLKTKEGGVAQVSTLVSSVVSGFDGWSASAQQIGVPAFAKQLSFDYESAFIDAYIRDPDVDRANEAATKQIQRDWAVSPAGGGILMKNPPEKAGYKQVMGSFDWIEKQARKELGLAPGQRYELISDDRTASEVAAAKVGGMPPSYQVVVYDESGVPRLRTIEGRDGPVPARINFSMTPDLFQLEDLDYDRKMIEQELNEIDTELGGYLRTRTPPPAILTRQREQLQQQLDGVTRGMQELAPPEVEPELPDNQKPWSGLGNIGATPGAM